MLVTGLPRPGGGGADPAHRRYLPAMVLASVRPLLVALAAVLVAAPAAGAAEYTVTTTSDSVPGSLRDALQKANTNFGPDVVTVPAGTYTLTSGTLSITQSVTLQGAGAARTIVDGTDPNVVLSISGGSPVTVRGIALTGGVNGVYTSTADVLLDRVALRDNTGSSEGTGLRIFSGNVQLLRSSVTNNRLITDASTAAGAGIVQGDGTLTVIASTIAGNQLGGDTAATRPNAGFGGGYSRTGGGTAIFRHVTFSGNGVTADSAAQYGGSVYSNDGTALSFEDTLLTGGRVGANAQNCSFAAGVPGRTGRNLDSGTTCAFGAGHLAGVDPLLPPLGATPVLPPALRSPAVNAASACVDGGDQRGAAQAGPACDIGAAELSSDIGVTLEASRTDVAPDGDVTYVLRVANSGPDAASAAVLDVAVAGGAVTLASTSSGTCTKAVRCDLGTLGAGDSALITVAVRAGASGAVTVSGRASTGTPDAAAGNDGVTASAAIRGAGGSATPAGPVLGALKLAGRARSGRPLVVTSRLSTSGSVVLSVARLRAGHRVGGRCRGAATKGPRCTVAAPVGSVTRTVKAGALRLSIPPTLRGKVLSPGRYRVTAVGRSQAGVRSAARTLTFTVSR